VRLNGFPALPWIVTAKLPQKLPGSDGNRIVIHTILLANATNTISLSQKDIVAPSDTVSAGLGFNLGAVRAAFASLPTPSDEGIAAQEALSAIDRGDLQGIVIATLHYLNACARAKTCSDSLRLSMQQEIESNGPWLAAFEATAIVVASKGRATRAAVAALTEEELGINRILQLFRAALRKTGTTTPQDPVAERAGVSGSAIVVDSAGNANIVINGKEMSLHAATNASLDNITVEDIETTINNGQSFTYLQNGSLRTGYYNQEKNIFLSVGDRIVNVFRPSNPKNYIANLKAR